MPTRLLRCTNGFLDSEEMLPIDDSDLTEKGKFNSTGMNENEIKKQVKELGGDYYDGKRRIVAYKFSPRELSQ